MGGGEVTAIKEMATSLSAQLGVLNMAVRPPLCSGCSLELPEPGLGESSGVPWPLASLERPCVTGQGPTSLALCPHTKATFNKGGVKQSAPPLTETNTTGLGSPQSSNNPISLLAEKYVYGGTAWSS